MAKHRDSMIALMQLKGYSVHTIRSYLSAVVNFIRHYKVSADKLSMEKVKEYLLYLRNEKKVSSSLMNQTYSALKLLYTKVLNCEWDANIPRMKRRKTLPNIISKKEIIDLFSSVKNLKHRTALKLLYTSGLRLSEVVNLKLKDIDSQEMTIRVNSGKGAKDRFTILSKTMLEELRIYYKCYRPSVWLFEGITRGKYCTRSIQNVFAQAKKKAKITKPCSCHTLRHCFATHLLEQGLDIYKIKELLGHSDIKTTTVYLHLCKSHIKKIKDPLLFLEE